jgi:hypothetical protein
MTLLSLLSPKARALVEAGKGAARPSAADRERIQAALRSRLGPEALGSEASGASTATSTGAAGPGWPLVAGVIAGLGAVGGLLFLALRAPEVQERPPEVVPPAVTAAPAIVSVSSARPVEAPSPPSSAPPVASSEAPTPAARSKQDRLSQEVALLSSATKSLNAGRAAEALKVLDEHQRKFPGGLLTEERRAARAQALCSLGRISEAKSELARLAPRSPAAARVQQVCVRARAQSR